MWLRHAKFSDKHFGRKDRNCLSLRFNKHIIDTPKKWYDGFEAGIHTVYVGEVIGAWKK